MIVNLVCLVVVDCQKKPVFRRLWRFLLLSDFFLKILVSWLSLASTLRPHSQGQNLVPELLWPDKRAKGIPFKWMGCPMINTQKYLWITILISQAATCVPATAICALDLYSGTLGRKVYDNMNTGASIPLNNLLALQGTVLLPVKNPSFFPVKNPLSLSYPVHMTHCSFLRRQ